MIQKLKSKITWIIVLSLSIPFLTIMIFIGYSNYSNLVHTTNLFIERVYGEESPKKDLEDRKIREQNPIELEGMYSYTFEEGKTEDSTNEEVDELAEEAYQKKATSGIVGDYIYHKRKTKKSSDTSQIVLVESSESIHLFKMNLIFEGTLTVVFIGLVFVLAKKLSSIITKPVEETFEKQKEFISDASHELKTPLAVIQANAEVLSMEVKDNKWLHYIENETENMSKLINEMLLLSKTENMLPEITKEEINLSEEIEFQTASFESMAYEKKVKLKTNIEENIKIKVARDDINHILSTLLDNAIKHTNKNKKVEVELYQKKDGIYLNVKNEGEEIPLEEREKIFERFYRVDKARNREEKRYGLGLAIAKNMVQRNRGTIHVDCQDGITTFQVKLPK